jgi:hypothetical protein
MKAWRVYTENQYGEETDIDTVFFDKKCDADYVRHSLINHDGLPSNIIVEEA